jgi:hypothetical protein
MCDIEGSLLDRMFIFLEFDKDPWTRTW